MTTVSSLRKAVLRSLKPEEVDKLIDQGCTCNDWADIQVAEGFDPAAVRSTNFSGRVRLGALEKKVSFFGGVNKPSGISNATIHNCTIGNNVYIDQIRNYIANYVIEDDTVIENVDLLAVEGTSTFGNGTQITVVNEAGGREIPAYDELSAHTAYVIAFYRHRPQVIEKLRKLISDYTESVRSDMGLVAKGSRLINCRIIKNVRFGQKTTVEGVNRLENGSVNSCEQDPVYIGPGVYAENFICSSGCKVTDGTVICNCFVGQGTELAKHYSAEHSVFFANCGGFHGEACAIFAGPYTVTHHKSTLLIAGLFSFLNAGSGTNQSNHMYKLGPNHQGIIERGSKTGSDSYILWPAKVGAFTVVMGRHYKNSDTSELPFSYLIEHEDESILVPGVNLKSVGTVRDALKWPKRDKRKSKKKLDYINFKLLSPYTIQKALNGYNVLTNLKATSGQTTEYYTYNNVKIRNTSLDNGIKLYQTAINKFLGNCLIKRLKDNEFTTIDDLHKILKTQTETGTGKWLDLAGLIAPQEAVHQMLDKIENETISTLEQLENEFESIHNNYDRYEWTWVMSMLQQYIGKSIDIMTVDDIVEILQKWKEAVTELDDMLCDDAKKEFSEPAQIGFGIDGDNEAKHKDFKAVRGTFEENSFVREIEKHKIAKAELGDAMISRLEKLRC